MEGVRSVADSVCRDVVPTVSFTRAALLMDCGALQEAPRRGSAVDPGVVVMGDK